ncbi:MAG: hypothetical protein HUJ25_03355 [Crocinitomicaceae bacterium]|nr:hypothetical protein [Crocinitomicaceae bacterium]
MKRSIFLVLSAIILLAIGCTVGATITSKDKEPCPEVTVPPKKYKDHLRYLESSLDSLHHIKSNPIPGEWLYHNRELQQYPHQFLQEHPNILEEKRNKVYIQPIGSFSKEQTEILKTTSEYISVFYHVECIILDSISSSEIPEENTRMVLLPGDEFKRKQFQTTYIMNEILQPKLPKDARAYMGFTNVDLYPNDSYNFVFGQGKIGGYLGIYSINRLGFPEWDSTAYRQCLSRTLKLATHELGHIFGFRHCVEYECLMNGSNSLQESDNKPYYLCPHDIMKVSQGLEIEETYRFEKIADFWDKHAFPERALFYRSSIRLLKKYANRIDGGIHNN